MYCAQCAKKKDFKVHVLDKTHGLTATRGGTRMDGKTRMSGKKRGWKRHEDGPVHRERWKGRGEVREDGKDGERGKAHRTSVFRAVHSELPLMSSRHEELLENVTTIKRLTFGKKGSLVSTIQKTAQSTEGHLEKVRQAPRGCGQGREAPSDARG